MEGTVDKVTIHLGEASEDNSSSSRNILLVVLSMITKTPLQIKKLTPTRCNTKF